MRERRIHTHTSHAQAHLTHTHTSQTRIAHPHTRTPLFTVGSGEAEGAERQLDAAALLPGPALRSRSRPHHPDRRAHLRIRKRLHLLAARCRRECHFRSREATLNELAEEQCMTVCACLTTPSVCVCVCVYVPHQAAVFQALVVLSGVIAFAVNLSIYWIIGNTSPLTYPSLSVRGEWWGWGGEGWGPVPPPDLREHLSAFVSFSSPGAGWRRCRVGKGIGAGRGGRVVGEGVMCVGEWARGRGREGCVVWVRECLGHHRCVGLPRFLCSKRGLGMRVGWVRQVGGSEAGGPGNESGPFGRVRRCLGQGHKLSAGHVFQRRRQVPLPDHLSLSLLTCHVFCAPPPSRHRCLCVPRCSPLGASRVIRP